MQTAALTAIVTAVNLEASDPHALAEFWAGATGGTIVAAGDQVYLSPKRAGGLGMFFSPMSGPRPSRNTTHVDLTVSWQSRADLVERLIARGATHRWDVLDQYPGVRWTTLADPEGNLFCIAEHPPRPGR